MRLFLMFASMLSIFGCKSASTSKPMDLSFVDEKGNPVPTEEHELSIYSGNTNNPRSVILRGQLGKPAVFFERVKGQEDKLITPVTTANQKSLSSDGLPRHHLGKYIIRAVLDPQTFTVKDDVVEIVSAEPVLSPSGVPFHNIFLTNHLASGPTNKPFKICYKDSSCNFTINFSSKPIGLSMDFPNVKQAQEEGAQGFIRFYTRFDVTLVLANTIFSDASSEKSVPVLFAEKFNEYNRVPLLAINGVDFKSGQFKDVATLMVKLDEALNAEQVTLDVVIPKDSLSFLSKTKSEIADSIGEGEPKALSLPASIW